MLRVGLTGGLASGKSTVARMLRTLGADLLEADELGRALMEPGQPIFARIAEHFGPAVVQDDGRLNRRALARLAFEDGRLQELNAIVHPAVIQAQQQWLAEVFEKNSQAVAVVESALIFEVARDARQRGEHTGILAAWRKRMDCVILVTAPEALRIDRYVARVAASGMTAEAARADARRRLAVQIPDAEKIQQADEVIENTLDLDALARQVEALWLRLKSTATNFPVERL